MERNQRNGRFLKGNQVAKKPDHRCKWCGNELTIRQISVSAKFCHVNCRTSSHKKFKNIYGLSVEKTV